MNYELIINLGGQKTTVFLQNGFYCTNAPFAYMHKHSYTELHAALNGSIRFNINGCIYDVESGNVIAIPPGFVHESVSHSPSVLHTAFQVQEPVSEVRLCSVSSDILKILFEEIAKTRLCDDYTNISALLSLICANIYPESKLSAHKVENHSFIISEFFSSNYNSDITLSSLANELHLSEKQTERLVVKYMGCNFKKALTNIRINTAKQLIAEGKLTLAEIAEYVGYRSYSGFWKAYNKTNQ